MPEPRWLAALVGATALATLAALWLMRAPTSEPSAPTTELGAEALEAAPEPSVLDPEPTRPNVVLVIGCTVRRDQTEPYGGATGTTPFLAELASSGTLFTDAIAAAPWTKPSAIALLTGHHALGLNMVEPGPSRNERILPESVTTLAERLGAAGYLTIGGTHNPNLDPIYGMDQGFAHYVPTSGRIRDVHPRGVELVDSVLAELHVAERGQRPVYLQLALVDAHTPRQTTPTERAAVADASVPPRVVEYRATLKRLDAALAHLAAGLATRGLTPEDTLFVFVADHGEALSWPAHHGKGHGFHLARSVTSVPWIVRGPSVPAGRRVPGLASHVDLAPTLLGLLGLPSDELPGHDLSPSIRGELRSTPRRRAYSDTHFYGTDRSAVLTTNAHCQANFGDEPSEIDPFVTGCFERRRDPDLSSEPRESLPLLSQLHRWRLDQQRAGRSLRPDDAEVPPPLSQLLEALGYAE